MPANSLKLNIQLDGWTEFSRTIHGAMQRADHLEPFFAAVAEEVRTSIRRRFEAEGAAELCP